MTHSFYIEYHTDGDV
jgi:hypothetical protein